MPCALEQFSLGDMLRIGLDLRRVADRARSMEEAADALCLYLRDELRDGEGRSACVLVRFYKTHPLRALPPDLKVLAEQVAAGAAPPNTRCLTLLATRGDVPEWNERRRSSGHQAIPLLSTEAVARAPMIAGLVRALGLDLAEVVLPSSDVVPALRGRNYGIFHVPEAAGSAHIPAQHDFVRPYGVRSVVGFGGTLPDGELFSVILFSRVPVTAQAADRFRNLALDVKGLVLRFDENEVFSEAG